MNTEGGRLYFGAGIDNTQLRRDAEESRSILAGIGQAAAKEGDRMDALMGKMMKASAGIFAVDRIRSFMGLVISTRSEVQSLGASFETLLGSRAKADELMGRIRSYAASTPMQLNDLAQGAQTLLGFNIEAEKVMPVMQAIGDISMGNREKFNSLTLAFAQMSATGKLMGQDLLQMINAGFNPLTVISEKTGKSISKLKDEMSAGSIIAKMVEDAFMAATAEGGKFHGMLERQSQTLKGSISNLQGAFSDMLNDMGGATEGIMAKGINSAYEMVKNYQDTAETLMGLIAVVGAYKAALIVNEALEAAAIDTMHAKIAAIAEVNAAEATGFELEVQRAVSKGNLTRAEGEEMLMQYELAKARVADLTAMKAQAKAELESALAAQSAAAAKVTAAEEQVMAANAKYEAALRSGNGERIERAELALGAAQSELNATSKAHQAAMTDTATASKKASATATAAETAAQELNTLSMTNGAKATGFLTVAKTKLRDTVMKLYATMMAHPYAILAAAVAALGYGIYKLATYESDHEKAMKSATAAAEGQQASMREELSVLDDLNGRLKEAKKGSEEWKNAKEQVVSQFGKYFSGLDAEIEKTGTLASTYDRLTKAVRLSAAARAMEKYREDNDISEDVDSYLESIRKSLTNGVLVRGKDGKLRKTAVTGALRESIMQKTYEYIRTGDESIFDEKELGYLKKTGAFYRDPGFGRSQSATDRLRARFDTIRQGEELIAQRYGTSVDEIDGRTVAEEKENSTNLQTAYTEAAKKYTEAKKKKELMEKNRSAYTQAEWEAAQGELKSAKEEYEKLGGFTKEKKQTGPTAAQLEAKEENAEGKLADIMRKQAQERLRIEQDYEYQRWQSRIDLMQEGEAKVLAQQALDFDKEKAQLRRRMEDELETELNRQMAVFDARQDVLAAADKKYARKTFRDSDIDDGAMNSIRERYAKLEEDLTTAQRKAEADRLKAAQEAMDAYLREFGSYQQKREAIEADYDKRMDEAANAGERMMLEAQKNKDLSDLDYQQWIDSGDIALAFGDISTLSQQTIDRLIEDMERYREKVVATFDPEKIAKYEEALDGLRKADIADSFGMFAGSMPEYFIQRKSVGAQLDSAGENVNALYEQRAALYNRVIDLQQRYNEAKAKGEDTTAIEKELTSAKMKLDSNTTATEKAVNAFRLLQEQWDNLNSPEAKFMALATSVASVAGLVADLSGQASEMADALGDEGLGSALGSLGEAMGAVQGIANGFAQGGPVGGIMAAAGAAMNLVTKLAMAGDARHQRNIERLQERIDNLRKSYDHLGKAIDKAYSSDAARLIEQQEANLVRQRALVQQQLEEEQAKKKTDSDKVRQYKDQLEELDEQIAETKERAKDAIFGDDIKSQIDGFAEAYSSAWDSGESRVMSARDTVRKMMRQMVEESIKAAIEGSGAMERIRQNLLDFYADGVLTSSEQNYIYSLADELQKELDARFGQQSDLLRGDTLSQESTKGRGWETFSQESADVLNGRFAAFCETSEAIREINAGIAESVRQGLASAVEQRDLLRESLNIQIASMGHLEAISRNTRELATIREDLSKIEKHVRNNL